MALRFLAPRTCRHCRREFGTSTQAKASTSSLPEDFLGSTSGAPSNSSTDEKVSNLLASLRFEISQTNANTGRVWARVNEVHAAAPHLLSPELIYQAIPTLARYPPWLARIDRRRKSGNRVARVREEAEALYARYRYIVDRLQESGGQPLDSSWILLWLKGFEDLGYGPAAWRIWGDCVEAAEKNIVDNRIAHSVLIATVRWLGLANNDQEVQFAPIAKEALKESQSILDYLSQHGRSSWISKSLAIRILKETGSVSGVQRAVYDTFGIDLDNLDLNLPIMHIQESSAGPSTFLDKHTFNTLLQQCAEQGQLSKVISLFERAAYPLSEQQFSDNFADQNSFFTSSRVEEQENERPQSEEEASNATATEEQDAVSSTKQVEVASPFTPTSQPLRNLTRLSTNIVNTASFEIVINAAVAQQQFEIASHYLNELLEGWLQERTTYKDTYRHLLQSKPKEIYKLDANRVSLQALPSIPDAVPQPSILPTVHAIFTIFKALKTQEKIQTSLLTSVTRQTELITQKLEEDAAFWSHVSDVIKSVLHIRRKIAQQQGAENASRTLLESPSYRKEFKPALHLRLVRRAVVEMEELSSRLKANQEKLNTERFIARLLYELSGKRARHTVPRLRTAIKRAERWLVEDEQADEARVAAIRATKIYTKDQIHKRSAFVLQQTARQRAKVRTALEEARIALPHLVEDAVIAKKLKGNTETDTPSQTDGVSTLPTSFVLTPLDGSTRKTNDKGQRLEKQSNILFSGIHQPAYLLSLMSILQLSQVY